MLIGTSLNYVNERLLSVVVNIDSQGANTILSAVTGQIIRVYKMLLVGGGTVVLTVKDDGTALSGPLAMTAGSTLVLGADTMPWFSVAGDLVFTLDAGVAVGGTLYYTRSS